MNAYQQAFVDRCRTRGVDPSAVVSFSKQAAAAETQKAAEMQKASAAVKQALANMTPYQQGFAIRCAQRGLSAAKVAEFCQKIAQARTQPRRSVETPIDPSVVIPKVPPRNTTPPLPPPPPARPPESLPLPEPTSLAQIERNKNPSVSDTNAVRRAVGAVAGVRPRTAQR